MHHDDVPFEDDGGAASPGSCCAPHGGGAGIAPGSLLIPTPDLSTPPLGEAATAGRHPIPQAAVPAQTFQMGDAQGDGRLPDGEGPVHAVTLAGFDIDTTSVTNDAFAAFVEATGFRTEAEVQGYSAVFHLALTAPAEDVVGRPPGTPWWLGVRGADWRHPGGAGSSVNEIGDHPVVHVSWDDAQAYCAWAGRSLPTEAQWEAASRGGLPGTRFPWGDERDDWRMNIWQGDFPSSNTLDDGWLTTAPVHTYEPNAYGIWQTVGNVWEWCSDWYDPRYYGASPEREPAGPSTGWQRVLRGGSYLCHDSYCNRYRNSARSQNTPDSSMGNAGFRTVSRAPEGRG